jgi:transcriptional antiterminator RfaH
MHKHEHIAYANLRQREGIEAFFPRLKAPQKIRGRTVTVIEPVFPCYIFARFDLGISLHQVRFAFGVRGVISFGDQWPTIPDSEISSLREAFGTCEILDRPLPELPPGTEVDIVNGPFQGLRAVVSYYMPAAQRVKILVEMLCQSTPVEIGVEDISINKPYPEELLVCG